MWAWLILSRCALSQPNESEEPGAWPGSFFAFVQPKLRTYSIGGTSTASITCTTPLVA